MHRRGRLGLTSAGSFLTRTWSERVGLWIFLECIIQFVLLKEGIGKRRFLNVSHKVDYEMHPVLDSWSPQLERSSSLSRDIFPGA